MDDLKEKDLWIAVWVFSGQGGQERGIQYLNIFPGDKIFSLKEDEVRGSNGVT